MKKDKLKSRQPVKAAMKPAQPPQAAAPAYKYGNAVGLAGVVLLGILIYSNSFDCSFQFDDESNILKNESVRDFWNFRSWWNLEGTRRYLGFGSFALTYYFFEYDVWGWHLFNLMIHLAAALTVWRLTMLLFRTPALKSAPIAAQAPAIALAAAFLFVAHPLATQSVTYIVQRLAAQAALFYLLALALYVQARLSDIRKPAAWRSYAGAFLAGTCAILTKENAYTLPLAVLLFEIYFFQANQIGRLLKKKAFLLVAALLLLVFSLFFYQNYHNINYTLTLDTGGEINAYNYLLTQFNVIWKYIRLLFIPVGQNLEHSVPISQHFFNPRTFLAFLGLTALFGYGVFLFNKNRLVSFGILWFFLTLSIESSFLPIADLMFEHRTYLPSYGFFIAVCAGIFYPTYQINPKAARILFIGLIGVYSVLTFARNRVWKTPETLWSDVIKKAPLARAYNNRGNYYLERKEYEKAYADLTASIKISPNYFTALKNMAILLEKRGQYAQASDYTTRLISIAPNEVERADAYLIRGLTYYKLGAYEKAIEDEQKAIKLAPNHHGPYLNLSTVYDKQGKYQEALDFVDKAISLSPASFESHINRAVYLEKLGRYKESLSASEAAYRLRPENPDVWRQKGKAYFGNNQLDSTLLCYDRAIQLDPQKESFYIDRGHTLVQIDSIPAAIADFTRAIELSPDNAQAWMNRSIAYIKLKDWPRANADLERVMAINPNLPGARNNLSLLNKKLAQ